MSITKQEFIQLMKEKPEQKIVEKLEHFFSADWKTSETAGKRDHSSFTDGRTLVIPKNTHAEKPILIHSDNSMLLILAEEGSTAQIFLNNLDKQKKITIVRAIVQKDSQIEIIDMSLGESPANSNIIAHLAEQGAKVKITSLLLGKGEQKSEINATAIHNAPNTKSNIITRCIAIDKAKIMNRGLIKINKNAANSEGYQKQDALLLGQDAEVDAVPNLEIYNHDVKCSHGSTIGQLDEEQLFYLMSRGLSENDAKQKIIEGYFIPALEMIENEDIKEKMYATLSAVLEQK